MKLCTDLPSWTGVISSRPGRRISHRLYYLFDLSIEMSTMNTKLAENIKEYSDEISVVLINGGGEGGGINVCPRVRKC